MKDAPKELCVAGSPADRLPLATLKMPPLEALSVYARCLETDGSKRRVPAFPSWLARHCTGLALAKPRRDAPGVTESLCAPEDDAPHRKPARGGAGPKQGPDLNQGLERVILAPRDLAAPLPPPGLLSALGQPQEGPRGAARQEAPRSGGAEAEPSSPVGSSVKDARGFRDLHEVGTTVPLLDVTREGGSVHECRAGQRPPPPSQPAFAE